MSFCNHTLASCFELYPEVNLRFYVILLVFFEAVFTFFTALFLNGLCVYLILLPNVIPGNYKYIMLVNNVNNMAYITFLTSTILYGVRNAWVVLPASLEFLRWYMTIGLYLYKLPLTMNRLIAVNSPYNYELLVTKFRSCLLAGVFALLPAPLLAMYAVFQDQSPVHILFVQHIFIELLNQSLHLAVFLKLSKHLRSNKFGSMSTSDSRFQNLREAIKSNFLQSFLPLIVQSAVPVVHTVRMFIKPEPGSVLSISLMVITHLSHIAFHITPLIDPICIFTIITPFRNEWTKLCYSKSTPLRYTVLVLAILFQIAFSVWVLQPMVSNFDYCACQFS